MAKRAVIWTAVSSPVQAKQDKISLGLQERLAREWCAANDYDVVALLCVPGHSRAESDIITLFEDYAAIKIFAYHDLRKMWQAKAFDVLVAYSKDRLARSATGVTWVIENTIRSGALLYTTHDAGGGGWITPDNYRFSAAIGGIAVTHSTETFQHKVAAARADRFERGITHAKPPMSHLAVRDASGRHTGDYILDARYTALWRDVAALLLEGVAWDRLEAQLYSRFGHVNPADGKPFGRLVLRRLVQATPMFWGHIARHHTRTDSEHNSKKMAHRVSAWLWDESQPVPEGVQLKRHVVPPVWTGALAEKIKAELNRRTELRGRAYPEKTYMFSGLCVCEQCGYLLSTSPMSGGSAGKIVYLRCMQNGRYHRCGNNRSVRYDAVQAWLTDFIAALLDKYSAGEAVTFEDEDSAPRAAQLVAALHSEAAQIDTQITKLINELSLLPDEVSGRVRSEIKRLSTRRRAIDNEIMTQQTQAQRTQQAADGIQHALKDIAAVGLEAFWRRDSRVIHQTLHRLFGEYRLFIDGVQIRGLKRRF